ncbi:MAG: sugar phosphate nucleotidyltransferase [Candidatus Methanofastidiosia archaeon]
MRCLILAGGFATRMYPITEKRPKALLPIGDKPILTHIVEKLPEDFELTVSVNAKFKRHFLKWSKYIDRKVEIFSEKTFSDDEKLGAVGGVNFFVKRKKISEDLLLLAGDNLFDFDLRSFLKIYGRKPLVALYELSDLSKVREYGVATLKGKRIVNFEEKPETPKSTLISTALYLLPENIFSNLEEFCEKRRDNLGGFLKYLVERVEVEAFIFKGRWFDVGSFETYLEAHKSIKKSFFEGTNLKNSILSGSVYLSKDCILSNSRIKDSILFEDCVIENSELEDCIVNDGIELRGVSLKRKLILKDRKINLSQNPQ